MRGRAMLLVVSLMLSAGLLLFLSSQPPGLAAQDSPLAPDSPLAVAPEATATPEPMATTTVTPTASATYTTTPTPTDAATATATATAAMPSATPTRRAVAAPTTDAIEPFDVDAFDAFIAAARRTFDVPGAAVAIIDGDEVLLAEGYGVRQLGAEAAVDADTRFVLGGASHLLLASAAAALADAGVIELDRPVVEYLPEFALYDGYAGDHATLRDLLAHRTGLPAYTGDLLDKLGLDRGAALAQLQYLPPAVSFRGQEGFSNLGIFAAAEVLDAVEDKPWEEIVAERIFTPLGMARSSGYSDALLEDENVAAAHFDAGTGVAVGDWPNLTVLGAAGQTAATLADLTAWVRMALAAGELDGEPLLTAERVQDLFAPAMVGGDGGPLQDPLVARCLGCTTYYYRGHRIVEAAGAAPGSRALLLLAPDDDLGLIVLANRDLTALPEAVRNEFLEQLFGAANRNLQADARALEATWKAQRTPPTAPPDPFEPTLALTGYAGNYASDFFGDWIISSVLGQDRLEVAAGLSGFPGDLLPFDGDTFLLTWRDANEGHDLITFTLEGDLVTGFTSTRYGEFTRTGD